MENLLHCFKQKSLLKCTVAVTFYLARIAAFLWLTVFISVSLKFCVLKGAVIDVCFGHFSQVGKLAVSEVRDPSEIFIRMIFSTT